MADYILKNLSDFIYVTDPATRCLIYSNKPSPNASQCGGDPVCGAICWEVLYGAEQGGPCDFCPYEKLLASPGSTEVWESRVGNKFMRNASKLIHSTDGRALLLNQSTDITEYKLLASKLENSKNNYLSRMSHEILTPMNAIIGMSRIASATDDISKIKDCLVKIDNASRQLLDIINSIYDISKLESNKLNLSYENVNMTNLLSEINAEISSQASERGQSFLITADAGVPVVIRTDGKRLAQVLRHLLHNAVKFTPDGGDIGLRIKLTDIINSDADAAILKSAEGGLTGNAEKRANIFFTVSDTGIGIPDDKIPGLFDAFEQVDGSTSRVYGGVGLGLAIARQLIKLMGGEISVESELGVGSVFKFNIVVEIAWNEIYARYAATDVAEAGVNGTIGTGVNETIVANVNESIGTGVNEIIGTNVNETVGADVIETAEAYVNETIGTNVNETVGTDVIETAEAYETFLPSFDTAAALQKLKGKTKLYMTMLATLKTTAQFDDMRSAFASGDFKLIGESARAFLGTAQNLHLLELSAVLGRIEKMARRKVMRPELGDKFETAAKHIFDKLDELISTLNNG